jgi:hypothetical protein
VFDTVLECAGRLPSPHCEIFIGRLGGVAARVAPDAMAYGNRDAHFVMNVHALGNGGQTSGHHEVRIPKPAGTKSRKDPINSRIRHAGSRLAMNPGVN